MKKKSSKVVLLFVLLIPVFCFIQFPIQVLARLERGAIPQYFAQPPRKSPTSTPKPPSGQTSTPTPKPSASPSASSDSLKKLSPRWVLLFTGGYLSLYLAIFFFRPLLLLTLDDWLKPVTLQLSSGIELSPRLLLWLRYHPRVLDAWVLRHLPTVRKEFLSRDTVTARRIHLPVAVKLEQQLLPELQGASLRDCFESAAFLLLISGEGGSGKTSLACQIAGWGMSNEAEQRPCAHRLLPILLETELSNQKTLPDAIRQQLPRSDAGFTVSDDLLKALLRHRRLLVIVDHFSEMGDRSRQQIQADLLKWPTNALIVTSRLDDELFDRGNVRLQPQRVEGGRLFDFFSAYLNQQGCRDAFDDEDLFQACRRLTGMSLEREITVLLAKLYIEQLIEAQLGLAPALPDNIPDLMRSYLNRLNASVDKTLQHSDLSVQRWVMALGWLCLQDTYQPTEAWRDHALELLGLEVEEEELAIQPTECLDYLDKRLHLIQIQEPGDKLRITLDPLAEYLAGLYVVAHCGNWPEFLDTVKAKQKDPSKIRGFLMALRDCCQVKDGRTTVPDFVPDALVQLAGEDPTELAQARCQLRIRRLTNNLVLPDTADRAYAAAELGKFGQEAHTAIAALERRLFHQDEVLVVRRQVLKTLVAVGWPVIQCSDLLDDEQVALSLRCLAAGLLRQQEASLERPIPDAIVVWRDGQQHLRLEEIPVEKEDLGEGVFLEQVRIPGGSVVMGAPEYEPGRYEVEGPCHRVDVAPFLLGRYPVTQTQWRRVTGWEAVEQDLSSDPSQYMGEHLPVATVSWYEALEFCARLSRQTGRLYRLPSEAEWEYACRAGTTTAYHLGGLLTADMANIDRSVNQTTPVGLYGVANPWGLYDMHGNVWEWCQDHWHDNYKGAPTDARAWIEGGESARRIVRGGSWSCYPWGCRSAYRGYSSPSSRYNDIGFRVVCVVQDS